VSVTHEHAGTVRNHWWWRPGWRQGRRFYTWHLTFEHATQLHDLVDAYQHRLAALPNLDLIPREWLHLTMQGVGFVDETPDDDLHRLVDAAQHRLANVVAPQLTFQDPLIRPEAVVLPAEPADSVIAIRDAIRAAFTDASLGDAPEQRDGYLPHVSVAYINHDGSTAPILAALEPGDAPPATVTIRAASLIVLDRDERMYQWQDQASAALGSSPV
jgi:2'-5' RNA ligase